MLDIAAELCPVFGPVIMRQLGEQHLELVVDRVTELIEEMARIRDKPCSHPVPDDSDD